MANSMVMSVTEMANELGMSRAAAYELIHREGFPAIRLSPRKVVVLREGLMRWLEEQARMNTSDK